MKLTDLLADGLYQASWPNHVIATQGVPKRAKQPPGNPAESRNQ